jgi:hypothetical protein
VPSKKWPKNAANGVYDDLDGEFDVMLGKLFYIFGGGITDNLSLKPPLALGTPFSLSCEKIIHFKSNTLCYVGL